MSDVIIILPAAEIPEGSTVMKVTGEKPHILKDTIKIYGETKQQIKPPPFTRYLVDARGDISMISSHTMLKQSLDLEAALYLLHEMAEARHEQ